MVIDDGAINALSGRGSSLLPAGITKINGQFLNGDVIDIVAPSGKILGRGITNYSSREIQPLLGLNKEDIQTRGYKIRTTEIIHRDNLTLEIG